MAAISIISLILILSIGIYSFVGFNNVSFYEKNVFEVEKILSYKQFSRILTAGFIHTGWLYLIFNLLALYFFSSALAGLLNVLQYLLIFFCSLVGGHLLALYIHRFHSGYRAAGASGAISGLIYASIALFPDMPIGLFPLPISFPAWVYGIIFMLFTLYGIRNKKEAIGHEAHLGGAVAGMLIAITMFPQSIVPNIIPIMLILVPSLSFIILIVYKPHLLMINNSYTGYKYTIDQRYNIQKRSKEEEVDRILDKINRKGIKSLSQRERSLLKEYAESK